MDSSLHACILITQVDYGARQVAAASESLESPDPGDFAPDPSLFAPLQHAADLFL